MQHGLRDFQATDHAAGILAHQLASDVREFHKFQCLRDPAGAFRAGDAVQLRRNQKVFVAGEVPVGGEHLRDVPDVSADRLGVLHQIKTGDLRGSFTGRQQRRQHLDERALARAVGTKQAKRRAGSANKIQMVNGNERTKSSRQREDFHRIHA